jgi:1-aminocyclopropane-1-carboxylate deaminase/D-cysteine desulfhydrase-like pyridoxal-dependent ACC family enzyme
MPYSLIQDIVPEIHFKEPAFSVLNNPLFEKNKVQVHILRLDEIHPFISGNKLFKLIYFLKEAKESVHKTIITFGGAYSNHLAATAFACEKMNIRSVGIVRGEEPKHLSHTLQFCIAHKMQLEFISRTSYKNIDDKFLQEIKNKYGDFVLIPDGGFSIKGKTGAGLINEYFAGKNFTHVCLPVGTATTFAGLVDSNKNETEIMGFGVLKNFNDIEKRLAMLQVNPGKKYFFIGDYHFGGYAKKNGELISFMNDFYEQHKIPLDFVYTAKMMFGVYDLINKKYFAPGSKILCIHTGGLQGNDSLPEGELNLPSVRNH